MVPVTLLTAGVLAGAGCRLDVDSPAYIEREQKRFPVEGAASVADLDLKTFSGRIEIMGGTSGRAAAAMGARRRVLAACAWASDWNECRMREVGCGAAEAGAWRALMAATI